MFLDVTAVESHASPQSHILVLRGEIRTRTQRRCPYGGGKNVAAQRLYTSPCGAPRTMDHCSCWERAFSETRPTPLAPLQTPMARVVPVVAALTEGGGINAATRLYGVSQIRISRWPERLRGVTKR